ncbi:hypothetical protein [Halobacillus sp. B23F22_1]|uniref:hypothetical protein n=1 Tax=Halobacillus sp. B23F22_1 TaxID=3459514 RepID=UPI00373E0C73
MLIQSNMRRIGSMWLVITALFLLFYASVFQYFLNYFKTDPLLESHTTVLIIVLLVIGVIIVTANIFGILLFSILTYIFGKIVDSGATKMDFLYICSCVILTNMLINLPVAAANFFTNGSIIIPNNNIYFIVLNPFLLLSVFVFFKLLSKTNIERVYNFVFCGVYYVVQVASSILLHYLLKV